MSVRLKTMSLLMAMEQNTEFPATLGMTKDEEELYRQADAVAAANAQHEQVQHQQQQQQQAPHHEVAQQQHHHHHQYQHHQQQQQHYEQQAMRSQVYAAASQPTGPGAPRVLEGEVLSGATLNDKLRRFSEEFQPRGSQSDFSGLAGGGASAAAAAAAAAGQQALASSSEKPKQRHSSKYGFRFLKHERAILEKWYAEQDGRTAPITIRKEWVGVWNEHRKHLKEEHCEVSHQQVKQWFENMRRTRNHKGGKQPYSRSRSGGAGGAGGAYSSPGGGVAGEATMNPRLYLAASTGKMHTAINNAALVVSKHIEQLQQIANSPIVLSPKSASAMPSPGQGGNQFRWDAINLKAIVDKLLSLLDSQIHNPNPALPSPRTTVTQQQEFHFQIFKQMLDIDRQIEPEWDALRGIISGLEANPGDQQTEQHASELVDMYMLKLEHLVTEKTKVMVNLIGQLPILPNPNAAKPARPPAPKSQNYDPEELQKHAAWTRSWTIPPSAHTFRRLESKLCVFMGCFLNDEQRANFFLGVPVHASALASAVCFSLESGDSERLTSQQAQNLVSLYEVAAVQELELSEQLDKLWNLKPIQNNSAAVDSWRLWLEDHHNPDIYYPLKVLADAVPAVDQQYGFISVTRNSLVLSLGFLKGLRYALPLPLFTKCMINFTQAHYLFATAAMLEELSCMVNADFEGGKAEEPKEKGDHVLDAAGASGEVGGEGTKVKEEGGDDKAPDLH